MILSSNVAEKVFRIRELELNFNTYDYKTGDKNIHSALFGISER